MISTQVCSRVSALSRGLALHWQERSSCLSQWIQHTDFIWHYSMYTCLTLPAHLQPWLLSYVVTPRALSTTVKQAGFRQVSTHELLLSRLSFYWKWQGSALETGGDGELSVAPCSTHSLAALHNTASGTVGYVSSGRQPRGLRGAHTRQDTAMVSQCGLTALRILLPPFPGSSLGSGRKLTLFRWVSSAICKTCSNCLNSQ